jgi:hypothetical protein
MSVSGGPNIVENGLVLYLDAANTKSYGSGSTVWNDLSGNNNSGSLINGTFFNTGSLGSLVFDGVNDYVTGTNVNITNQLTVLITINPQQRSGTVYPVYIGKWNVVGGSNDRSWVIGSDLPTDGKDYIAITSNGLYGGTTTKRYQLSNSIIYDTWYQIGFTFTNNNLIPYKNGSVAQYTTVLDGTVNTIYSSNINYSIGRTLDGSFDLYYKGRIATVQIYNRALTPQEILQNYNATKRRYGL